MKRSFLRLLTIVFLCSFAQLVSAQSGPYGNEWIDFSKTYYKFKVGVTGPCRIYRPALAAAGLPAGVLGSNLILYRDGKEVPVYMSADNMGSSDYIEFWGRKADGMLDKELYLKPEAQPNDRISLFTDTACYYLTYDGATNHARFAQAANAIPGTTPAPEPFALATVGDYARNAAGSAFSPGPTYQGFGFSDLVSSEFDNGEGFVKSLDQTDNTLVSQLNLDRYISGYPATFHGCVVGRSLTVHNVRLLINNQQIADSAFGAMEAKHFDLSIPASKHALINTIYFTALNPSPAPTYDKYGIAFTEMEYARDFSMSAQNFAAMRIPANGAAQYLEFTSMGSGRLYDLTNNKWYDGNTAVSGKTRFYLDPSATTRDIVVMPDAGAAAIPALAPVRTMQFTNYAAVARQGNFIIISHKDLMAPAGGRNYVQEYAAYRASATGGRHSVATVDVTELYDQFAYGYDIHPLAVKHFLKYAYTAWAVKPADVLLIGHGLLYKRYPAYRSAPAAYPYPIVPTYGDPGSDVDFVLWGGDHTPKMRIGRLSVWVPSEIGTYLTKIQDYEAALPPAAFPTTATELWKKRVLHAIGTSDASLQSSLEGAMDKGALIIMDTLTGKKVWKVAKSSSQAVTLVNSAVVDTLLRTGLSMITFYGHASLTTFDYVLPDPAAYNAASRLPFFMALGCDAGQMFELSPVKSISERYTLGPTGGATVFLASDNVSFAGFDDKYLDTMYHSISHANYGAPVGTHANRTLHDLSENGAYPNFSSAQLESMILGGDPSIIMASPPKPDYHIAAEGLAAIPSAVSTRLDSFSLRITSFNLGKAIADSVQVKVEHISPSAATSTLATYTIRNLHYSDTTILRLPVPRLTDVGINKYAVTIDAPNRYDEISEINNTASLELFLYSDNLVPVYPPNFGIVNKPAITLKASVLNPFRAVTRYRMEMDTSELFTSPVKQFTVITSPGGVIKWTPPMQLSDNTVYYWRASFDSTVNGAYQWAGSSFVYIAQGAPGWNQSHYYQYGYDASAGLNLGADRMFRYNPQLHTLAVGNKNIGSTGNENADVLFTLATYDNVRAELSSYGVSKNVLQIGVIDSNGRFFFNDPAGSYGADPSSGYHGTYFRQYNLYSLASRNAAARFLDTIPNGWYVVVRNIAWHYYTGANDARYWLNDSATAGSGKTLYDALKRLGFSTIDSFTGERVFIFACKKGDNTFPVTQHITTTLTQELADTFIIKGYDIEGAYRSTVIGPAKTWQSLQWKTVAPDTMGRNDISYLSISGIDAGGIETVLAPRVVGDTSLDSIPARQYPNLRLVWHTRDSVNCSSPQLAYWRVLYAPFPEAALNPAAHFVFTDSLAQGQMQTFSTAIENLTELPMDSMLVRFKVIGADGVARQLADRRYRPLPGNDTLHADITFDPSPYPGKNTLFVEANPANDQPELYHPNNLGYLPFRISVDNTNPLLDVTFDGIHILNGDIVSAKPYIKIRLKDENRYLTLNDTGLIKVQLRYPGQTTPVDVPFDGVRCRFVPATAGGAANEAMVAFRPQLADDGIYQLSVTGADRSGNGAGTTAGATQRATYSIEFAVDNKPSITRVLNYPNPFSTATAFCFTMTGSQIPSQLKIQIMSVTGKVVREITRDELGPLHIGRNITSYQWDGRDQFGQLLGNGVYLYRVVTSLNGQDVDIRSTTSADGGGVDRFFRDGWGKMYIMR